MCPRFAIFAVLILVLFVMLALQVRAGRAPKGGLAQAILAETDPAKYAADCNTLFHAAGDPAMAAQWDSMRASRSAAEVNNLCGNYARSIVGQKA